MAESRKIRLSAAREIVRAFHISESDDKKQAEYWATCALLGYWLSTCCGSMKFVPNHESSPKKMHRIRRMQRYKEIVERLEGKGLLGSGDGKQ